MQITIEIPDDEIEKEATDAIKKAIQAIINKKSYQAEYDDDLQRRVNKAWSDAIDKRIAAILEEPIISDMVHKIIETKVKWRVDKIIREKQDSFNEMPK